MNDLVSSFSSKGVSAALINEASHELKLGVLSGDYQLVFLAQSHFESEEVERAAQA